jgi:preprotein translocase subunit Sec63
MSKISYEDLEKSVQILGLIGLENRDKIKKKYLKLSKQYHPDMPNGDSEKFQEINKAYKILNKYIENFKFRFSKEEFTDQHPLWVDINSKSVYKTI